MVNVTVVVVVEEENSGNVAVETGLKNGWTCALRLWGSSRHSIFKMADDE